MTQFAQQFQLKSQSDKVQVFKARWPYDEIHTDKRRREEFATELKPILSLEAGKSGGKHDQIGFLVNPNLTEVDLMDNGWLKMPEVVLSRKGESNTQRLRIYAKAM